MVLTTSFFSSLIRRSPLTTSAWLGLLILFLCSSSPSISMAAKLYFRYGVVSASKTLNLLAVAHTYRQQGKRVLLIKPAIDTRYGRDVIQSKAGVSQVADIVVSASSNLMAQIEKARTTRLAGEPSRADGLPSFSEDAGDQEVSCVLVDECQFLDPEHVDDLRRVATEWNIPVIAYGLRTDFRTHLFPGSRRLCELADAIEEIKTTCQYCNRKAIFNLKHVNGVADFSGPTIQLGAEERYFPTCSKCYYEQKSMSTQPTK